MLVISTECIHPCHVLSLHKGADKGQELISQLYPVELYHLENHSLILDVGDCHLPVCEENSKGESHSAARPMPQRSLSD